MFCTQDDAKNKNGSFFYSSKNVLECLLNIRKSQISKLLIQSDGIFVHLEFDKSLML